MKLQPSTLRLKIFLAMTAVLAGFALVVTGVVGSMVDRFIELEMSSSLGRANDAYGEFARQRKESLTQEVQELAQAPELAAILSSESSNSALIEGTLAELHEGTDTDLILLADSRGMLVMDSTGAKGGRSLADRPGMFDVLTGSEFYGVWEYDGKYYSVGVSPVLDLEPGESQPDGSQSKGASAPQPNATTGSDRSILGLVALGTPIDAPAAHDLAALTSTHVIFTKGNDPIAWSLIDPPRKSELSTWLAARDLESLELFDLDNPLSLGEVNHVATLVSLPGDEAGMIICRPYDDVIAPFLSARNEILAVGGLMVLMALFVSRSLSTRMGRPIQALTAAADAMRRGDLTANVGIETQDELAVLGQSFNAMARTMKSLVETAKEEARHAARAAEAKSAFLATMSHEIRTPLNGILGFSEELLHSELSSEQREYTELVHGSGRDLKNIIDSVLSYSQIEAGQARIQLAPFRVHKSIESITTPQIELASLKGLEMTVSIEPDVPDRAIGSKIRFEKVLQVLVDNAVRFTEQGRVSVRVSLEGASEEEALVRVAVRDTGIGITPEQLELVFNPFMQLDQRANRKFGGSGLGLAIARDLAEQMGGTCEVESELGFGSTFWFTIALGLKDRDQTANVEGAAGAVEKVDTPNGGEHREPESDGAHAKQDNESEAGPALPSRERIAWYRPSRDGKRVLVVEDNPVNQKMATMLLRKAGLEFQVADNGEQALEVLSSVRFDLILMDCQMPVMDGFETTRRIRELERDGEHSTPILALTANTMEGDRETCLAAGMDGFIGKPFTAETLILALDRWLDPTPAEQPPTDAA